MCATVRKMIEMLKPWSNVKHSIHCITGVISYFAEML